MKRDLAVALGYRPDSDLAPKVLASGHDLWARRIIELAEHHGIPTRPDGDLAELLEQLPLANEIPEELYPAVAEIFAFLVHVAEERARA